MKASPLAPLVACLLAISLLSVSASDPRPPKGFYALFNGRDLIGWYGNNPHATQKVMRSKKQTEEEAVVAQQAEFIEHWTVENGELVNDGKGPYATTARGYDDIDLRLEYKTVAKADSGIYLRGTPQVQIWDTTKEGGKHGYPRHAEKGSGGLHNNSTNSPGKWPSVHADRPFGQWNSFRILQLGSRTSVWLNDQLVVSAATMENYWDKSRTTPLRADGPIMLQTHGGEIRWRNVFVREFTDEQANRLLRGHDRPQGFRSIFNGRDLRGWTGETASYTVRHGAIVCREGMGGTLFTKEQYEDFVVRLEFKLPPGGNNGLAIRYPGTGQPHLDGFCELQVLDNKAEKYAKLQPHQYHGSAYKIVPAHRGYLRPVGEWNFQEVTVIGSRVKVELNGTVILDADLDKQLTYDGEKPQPGRKLRKGHFGFAGHKDPVMFRRIAIKKL